MIVAWPVFDRPQPTGIEWDKFQRYASWMRRLNFDRGPFVPDEVLRMLSSNSPNRTLFPGLRELTWVARSYPLDHLFLSPRLTKFLFRPPTFRSQLTDEVVSNLASVVAELPASSLRFLWIDVDGWSLSASVGLRSAVSSAALRCGPSLADLSVPMPLSDPAVQHIMQLPKLTTWRAWNGPPRVSVPSLSDAFPQLETLHLNVEASLKWLPLFEAVARWSSPGQGAHVRPHCGPGQKLADLQLWVEVSVDTALISPIMLFRGLVTLAMRSSCYRTGECTFGLTDGDIVRLTTALPNLVIVTFGETCSANSCRTTVSSLLFFSTGCKNLKYLEIHFNTTNLRGNLESMAQNPRLRGSYGLPRCQLTQLSVSCAPLSIEVGDYGPVLAGFLDIFPSLEDINGESTNWDKLDSGLSVKG